MIRKLKNKYKNHREKQARKKAAKKQFVYELKNAPSAYDEAVLSWIAPETVRHERGPVWKVIMGALIAGIVVWGALNQAWTFSLTIVAFAVTYYLVHLEHPKDVEIKISDIGIKVGGKKYPYSRIKSFWIIYEPPFTKTLNIRVTGEMISDITIQLNGQSPAPVRGYLMEKIPELEGQTEKVSDIILRLLKI